MSTKESLYSLINSTKFGRAVLETRRNLRNTKVSVDELLNSGHTFIDRSTGSNKLCIILAGYKEVLWDDVFARLSAVVSNDVDVCIMTSGLKNDSLMEIAKQYNWSYLATEKNHLSLIQNRAIELHPNAKWIYKLDEDMFLTEGYFEVLYKTYQEVLNNSYYVPAFVSPLINVSCYGHIRLLEKCNLLDDFRATGLTDVKITDGLHHNRSVLENSEVSKYMWGSTQPVLRDIDALTRRFSAEPLSFTVCPVRFSIGAILFTRDAWEEFGHFPLTFVGSEYGLGDDEEHICNYACFSGKAMIVSDNIVVGHLGYGPQTKGMIEYYLANKDRFAFHSK